MSILKGFIVSFSLLFVYAVNSVDDPNAGYKCSLKQIDEVHGGHFRESDEHKYGTIGNTSSIGVLYVST